MTTPPHKEKRKHADMSADQTPTEHKRQRMTQAEYAEILGKMDDRTRALRMEFFESMPNELLFHDHAATLVEWIQGHDTGANSAFDHMMAASRFEFTEEYAWRMTSQRMHQHARALLRALLAYCDRASLIREYADARRADIVEKIACVERWIAQDKRFEKRSE